MTGEMVNVVRIIICSTLGLKWGQPRCQNECRAFWVDMGLAPLILMGNTPLLIFTYLHSETKCWNIYMIWCLSGAGRLMIPGKAPRDYIILTTPRLCVNCWPGSRLKELLAITIAAVLEKQPVMHLAVLIIFSLLVDSFFFFSIQPSCPPPLLIICVCAVLSAPTMCRHVRLPVWQSYLASGQTS